MGRVDEAVGTLSGIHSRDNMHKYIKEVLPLLLPAENATDDEKRAFDQKVVQHLIVSLRRLGERFHEVDLFADLLNCLINRGYFSLSTLSIQRVGNRALKLKVLEALSLKYTHQADQFQKTIACADVALKFYAMRSAAAPWPLQALVREGWRMCRLAGALPLGPKKTDLIKKVSRCINDCLVTYPKVTVNHGDLRPQENWDFYKNRNLVFRSYPISTSAETYTRLVPRLLHLMTLIGRGEEADQFFNSVIERIMASGGSLNSSYAYIYLSNGLINLECKREWVEKALEHAISSSEVELEIESGMCRLGLVQLEIAKILKKLEKTDQSYSFIDKGFESVSQLALVNKQEIVGQLLELSFDWKLYDRAALYIDHYVVEGTYHITQNKDPLVKIKYLLGLAEIFLSGENPEKAAPLLDKLLALLPLFGKNNRSLWTLETISVWCRFQPNEETIDRLAEQAMQIPCRNRKLEALSTLAYKAGQGGFVQKQLDLNSQIVEVAKTIPNKSASKKARDQYCVL
jgi:tetratricopeptide (TPR) repeat protein